ncbi:MAG: hypothetical protein IKL49_02410 [Lachnospiraceae bacterium]|nr:hypothetical protein [Lachnospiraceae bacterium]
MLKKYVLMLVTIISMLFFAGCGEREELTVFKEQIDNFYTEVSALETEMNSITEDSENAVSTLLVSLEQMSEQFQKLADLDVPAEFISVEDLADDAASYMYEAVRLYGEAYEEDYVSDSLIQAATDNYESAMKRINYIAALLQGEIPEGATVIEDDGTEFEPYVEE